MQRDQNGADIPDKPLFVKTLGIVDSYPAGCPIPYPGPVAPDGYLLMDGRAFSKTLYPQLAKLYVDGVLPDMRGMYVRGWDNGRGLDVADDRIKWPMRIIQEPASLDTHGVVTDVKNVNPRGYKLKAPVPSSGIGNIKLIEGERLLLSSQFMESIADDLTGSLTQLFSPYNDYSPLVYPPKPKSGDIRPIDINLFTKNNLIYPGSAFKVDNQIYHGDRESCLIRKVIEYHEDHLMLTQVRYLSTSDYSIRDFQSMRAMPIGVPNVAFNYITKAA